MPDETTSANNSYFCSRGSEAFEILREFDSEFADKVDSIEYVALKLDPRSRAKLARYAYAIFGNAYDKVCCDHVTLAYGPEQVSEFDFGLVGNTTGLAVTEIAFDGKAAAASVEIDPSAGVPCANENPHVTLFVKDGTKPVYSNELLRRRTGRRKVDPPLALTAKVTLVAKDRGGEV